MAKNIIFSLFYSGLYILCCNAALADLKSSNGRSFDELYDAAMSIENADWKKGIIYPSAAYLSEQGISEQELLEAGQYYLANANGNLKELEMGAFFLSAAPLLQKAGRTLDELYSAALDPGSDIRKTYKDEYGRGNDVLTKVTVDYGYSPEDLRKHGMETLKKSKGNPQIVQKGFRFLEIDKTRRYIALRNLYKEKKIDLKERNKRQRELYIPTESDIKLGLIAKKAGELSAAPDSIHYNVNRALILHATAGDYGIQSSYIAAGYIHRFMDKTELLKTRRMSSLIETEAMYFRRATACSHFGDREVLPYTRELCDEASIQLEDANRRSSLAHAQQFGKSSDNESALWALVGVVGLAILAGATSNSEMNQAPSPDEIFKNSMDNINRIELESVFVE